MPGIRAIVHVVGRYPPGRVSAQWVADTRPRIPQIEAAIEIAWQEAYRRLGARLFDGAMCRLESFHADDTLLLKISPTSYKPFVGTNLTNPQFAEQYGSKVLANAIGVSSIVHSSDDQILLGQRNQSVAYYPLRIHPFAGTLEPRDPLDVFAEARRELDEELHLQPDQIEQMNCIGLVEDPALHQPELVFHVRARRTLAELRQTLDPHEHASLFHMPATPASLAQAMENPALTPVACAALHLLRSSLTSPA